MQLTDLRIQKFNKISSLSNLVNPNILSSLQIVSPLCFPPSPHGSPLIHSFLCQDSSSIPHQLYLSRVPSHPSLAQIVYLKSSPKILYLEGDPQSLIIQQKIVKRLDQFLREVQADNGYVDEGNAREIMRMVTESLTNYLECKIGEYDCIEDCNVVLNPNGGKWELSVVGFLLGVARDGNGRDALDIKRSERKTGKVENDVQRGERMVFRLGCLLFKILFGFSPRDMSGFDQFQPKAFYKNLQFQKQKKLLKVYNYANRILQLTPLTIQLLQQSLTGKMPLQSWINHAYFSGALNYANNLINKNKQILMLNSVQPTYYSLIMSAINHKKNHPLQKLFSSPLPSPDEPSPSQLLTSLKKHPIFSHIQTSAQLFKTNSPSIPISQPIAHPPFFYSPSFDPETDYPCRQLIKFLHSQSPSYSSSPSSSSTLVQYAYPYALAFQLLKVCPQPYKVQQKIKQTIWHLLQLSAINYKANKLSFQPLHQTQLDFNSYEQIKPILREGINWLYGYFLAEAMRNYNVSGSGSGTGGMEGLGDGIGQIQRMKRKEKGLEYYRLCLKLIQGSLIMRRAGEINLARIQTADRREIEKDLGELLAKYFPKNVQLQ